MQACYSVRLIWMSRQMRLASHVQCQYVFLLCHHERTLKHDIFGIFKTKAISWILIKHLSLKGLSHWLKNKKCKPINSLFKFFTNYTLLMISRLGHCSSYTQRLYQSIKLPFRCSQQFLLGSLINS